jgi:hypothetical protein
MKAKTGGKSPTKSDNANVRIARSLQDGEAGRVSRAVSANLVVGHNGLLDRTL